MHMTGSQICGISVYLPDQVLSNEILEREFPDFKADKIEKKIGIKTRHIAAQNETAVDMAEHSARKLFAQYPESRNSDFLLLCTQSPDYILPTSACILQHRLGLKTRIGALDFNLGCSGYIYGLALAKGMIAGGIAESVLLITSETYSKYLNPQDKGNRAIFGDGAATSWICASSADSIGEFLLGTDGAGAENLIIKKGGCRVPFTEQRASEVEDRDRYLYMNGPEIFNFTNGAIPSLVNETLKLNKMTWNEIDYVVFHQANKYMLEFLRDQIGIPQEKFIIEMEQMGNIVSATIPVVLEKLWRERQIPTGSTILLAGFGVGYSYGATIIKMP